ncbi:glycosyltransferase family 2 protein [bacterium]|nr:glycosyltransferase family 2 protein [bacterium]MBQ9246000.1 glycosyltransferase family 2 protein [bacterium]MBQ9246897.1 glycosyltransferase family 2 protein [bacterium]
MKFGLEIKNSKLHLFWDKLNVDFYKIFIRRDNNYTECAQIKNENFTTLSLMPYGENEAFIRAIKNGQIVDQSPTIFFGIENIDAITCSNSNITEILCSEYHNSYGYRLYKSEDGINFKGVQNFAKNYAQTPYEKGISYKIKPYSVNNNERIILNSSAILNPDVNKFEKVTIHKSFENKMFISWNFKGYADGFAVFAKNSDYPIFETNDGKCHYAYIDNYKEDTEFKIKAFLNTPNGQFVISESALVKLSSRNYTTPEISLIIPAYNAKDYIARSIDSALASDFENLEILIINDGSTDTTQEVIDWYAKNYKNIVSIQKENGGVAHARNVGIEKAQGKYIAFMDNDDVIRPNMMSCMYNSITKNDCDIAIAPLYRLVDKGYTLHCKLPFETDTPIDIDKYFEILYTPGYYNCAIWNKLYKASIVKAHPLGILKYEDVSWTPCILSYAKNFCFLNTPFYEWDRKSRPETFGDFLAKMPENDLFEHRKQAMMFFIENGNPEKLEILKTIAKRRLMRYDKNSNHKGYQELIQSL